MTVRINPDPRPRMSGFHLHLMSYGRVNPRILRFTTSRTRYALHEGVKPHFVVYLVSACRNRRLENLIMGTVPTRLKPPPLGEIIGPRGCLTYCTHPRRAPRVFCRPMRRGFIPSMSN